MSNLEVRDQIKEMAAAILCIGPDEIGEAELLTKYGLNSIDLIDLVVKLEAHYQVKFDPATMRDLSVEVLAQNIERMLPVGA